MKCEIIREMMSLYIDREINDIDRIRFEKHLGECTSCKEDFELLADIVQNCEAMPDLELPENFREELHGKLLAASRSPMGRVYDFAAKYKLKAASGLVAAVLVIAVALNVGPLGSSKQSAAENARMESSIAAVEDAAGVQADENAQQDLALFFTGTAEPVLDEAPESLNTLAAPETDKIQPTSRAVTASPTHTAKAAGNENKGSSSDTVKNQTNSNGAASIKSVASKADDSNSSNPETANKEEGYLTATSTAGVASNSIESASAGAVQNSINTANGNSGWKVVRGASVSITSSQISSKAVEVERLVEAAGGYIDVSSISAEDSVKHVTITVRVPAARLDEVYAGIKRLGSVKAESITNKDITLEYNAAKERYDELKVQEVKLKELSSKSADAYEAMKIEGDLNKLRTEMAGVLDRLRAMDSQLQMPFIIIEIVESK